MNHGKLSSNGALVRLGHGLLFFFPLIFLSCILLVCLSWHEIKGSYLINTNTLQQATGKILSSKTRKSNYRSKTYYHYSIEYAFQVNGENYRSEYVTFVNATGTEDGSLANEYVKKYPSGKAVTVFYENGNPSFSVLEPDVKAKISDVSSVVLIIGLLGSVIGWLATFLFIVSKS